MRGRSFYRSFNRSFERRKFLKKSQPCALFVRLSHDNNDSKLTIQSRIESNGASNTNSLNSVKKSWGEHEEESELQSLADKRKILKPYSRQKLLDIYRKKLIYANSNRLTNENNHKLKESKKAGHTALHRDLSRVGEQLSDAVNDVDWNNAIVFLQSMIEKNARMPPLDEKLLLEAKNQLNEEKYSSEERRAFFFCTRHIKAVDAAFEKALIGIQTCSMTNKMPLALPNITKALGKLALAKEKIKALDPTFDLSYFDSPKFYHVITLFVRAVTRCDPRRAYADWAVKLMYSRYFIPTNDLLLSVLLLLSRIGEDPENHLLRFVFNKFVKSVLESDFITLNDVTIFSKEDLKLLFDDVVPKLTEYYRANEGLERADEFLKKLPSPNDVGLLFSAHQKKYSMLDENDKCAPYNKDNLPPQLDLSNLMSYNELIRNFRRQLNRESMINISMDSLENSTLPSMAEPNKTGARSSDTVLNKELELILDNWRENLYSEIEEELHSRKDAASLGRDMFQILQVLDLKVLIEQLINIAFSIGGCETSVPFFELYTKIEEFLFNSFYHQYLTGMQYIDKLELIYPQFARLFYESEISCRCTAGELWTELQLSRPDLGPRIHAFPEVWPRRVCTAVSKYLVHLMMKKCQLPIHFVQNFINQQPQASFNDMGGIYLSTNSKDGGWRMVPCFSFRYVTVVPKHARKLTTSHTHLHVTPYTYFSKLVRKLNRSKVVMLATSVPSLVPPVPWVGQNHGGYLASPSQFMRGTVDETSDSNMGQFKRKVAAGHSDVTNFMDCVYTFSSVPWVINKNILEVLTTLFRSGGSVEYDIPLSEEACEKYYEENPPWDDMTGELTPYYKWTLLQKLTRENFSLRMTVLYQLSIAHLLKNEKAFWMPSNIDFRGRCYDLPPVFNHIGDDKTRSLFLFAQGKPLGPKGLKWLKLHMANLTGACKKMAYDERLAFIDSQMDLILDSARDPLGGLKWWSIQDEPYQALACCFELSKAIKHPEPEKYVCHFPVHQDGSCNGLQHYAALGRDISGAKSVNVLPSDVPQDVYQTVCDSVELKRQHEKNEKYLYIAKRLEGLISRKVVKQTVMTQVYGVTYYGGLLQIKARLKEYDSLKGSDLTEATSYVTQLVFGGIGDLFTSTAKIKQWLRDISYELTQSGIPVEWVSPLGLPIVQSYTKKMTQTKIQEHGMVQSASKSFASANVVRAPDSTKHRNAFPPNYIHSLDATHMLLTSRSCFKQGVSFVHVHDCFWTHASDVDKMNEICREEFVNLHKLPLLENFAEYVAGNLLPQVKDESRKAKLTKLLGKIPPVGDLDLNLVKDSVFFFS